MPIFRVKKGFFTTKKSVYYWRVRLLILNQYLLKGFGFTTSIKSGAINRSFFILQVAEYIHHEFLAIMHHNRLELFLYKLSKLVGINHPQSLFEHKLEEQIEAIAKTKVVSFSSHILEWSIFLTEEVVT